MTKLLSTAIALLAIAPIAGAASPTARIHALPGASAFPESIGADARSGLFYTGSVVDGTVYRGTLDSPGASVFLPAGSDGRTNVAGVKVDSRGRIWVADAFNGRVLVYGADGRLLHAFVLAGPGIPTVNDIAFAHGVAYVTDSSRPFLYRIALADADSDGTTTQQPWLDVSGTVAYHTGEGPFGVNLNGIVASPDGRALVVIQTNAGLLFRVDTESREIAEVAVAGADLQFGDGLLRLGDRLLVARNAANQVAVLRLGPGWRSARFESAFGDPSFAFPTALAELRGRLLVTNSQLDAGASPSLPFTVSDLPLPEAR
jgi:sugar lactone lactonase YvrE